jgi:hypothetical protein
MWTPPTTHRLAHLLYSEPIKERTKWLSAQTPGFFTLAAALVADCKTAEERMLVQIKPRKVDVRAVDLKGYMSEYVGGIS